MLPLTFRLLGLRPRSYQVPGIVSIPGTVQVNFSNRGSVTDIKVVIHDFYVR